MNGRPTRAAGSGQGLSKPPPPPAQRHCIAIRGVKIQSYATQQTAHDVLERTGAAWMGLVGRHSRRLNRICPSPVVVIPHRDGCGLPNRRRKCPLHRCEKPRTFVDEVLKGMSPRAPRSTHANRAAGRSKVTCRRGSNACPGRWHATPCRYACIQSRAGVPAAGPGKPPDAEVFC
jgi:hypothetical protein